MRKSGARRGPRGLRQQGIDFERLSGMSELMP
jgi:hypothetical protein